MKIREYIQVKPYTGGGSGGGESPDPAIYCPANGYLPPYEYFESPIEVTVVSNESIVFILDTEMSTIFKNMALNNNISSPKKFSFYDADGNLLQEQTTTTGTSYTINQTIPDSPTQYVKCVVTLTNGSAVFTRLYSSVTSLYVYGIVAIYANTPNLAGQIMFRQHKSLKIVQFLSTLDYVTSFDFLFYAAGVERFTLHASMPALASMVNALIDSDTLEFIFPVGFTAPLLTSILGICSAANNIINFDVPSLPSVLNCNNLVKDNKAIKSLTISGLENATSNLQLADGADKIQELTLPEFPDITVIANTTNICRNMYSLRKLTMQGTWGIFSNNIIDNCHLLKELHLPRTMLYGLGGSIISTDHTSIQTIHVPDYINASAAGWYYYCCSGAGSPSTSSVIKKIYGDFEFSSGEAECAFNPTGYQNTFEEFNCPKLKVSRVRFGIAVANYRLSKLSVLEVDWENSSFSYGVKCIELNAPFDATWLNTMFTRLPVVTGLQSIDVRYCDGYATCDPSIATAKGWTVL